MHERLLPAPDRLISSARQEPPFTNRISVWDSRSTPTLTPCASLQTLRLGEARQERGSPPTQRRKKSPTNWAPSYLPRKRCPAVAVQPHCAQRQRYSAYPPPPPPGDSNATDYPRRRAQETATPRHEAETGIRRETDPAVQLADLSRFLCGLEAREGQGPAEAAPAPERDPHGAAHRCSLRSTAPPPASGGDKGQPAKGEVEGRGTRGEGVPRGCLKRGEPDGRALGPAGHTQTSTRRSIPERPDTAAAAASPGAGASQPVSPRTQKPAPTPSTGGQEDARPPSPAASPRGASHPLPRPGPRCGSRTVGSSGSICAPWSWVSMRRRGRGGALPAARPGALRGSRWAALGSARAPAAAAAALPPRTGWRGGRKRAPVTWLRAPPAPARGEAGAGSTCGMRPDPAAAPGGAAKAGGPRPCTAAPANRSRELLRTAPLPAAAGGAGCVSEEEGAGSGGSGGSGPRSPPTPPPRGPRRRSGVSHFAPGFGHGPPEAVASGQSGAKIHFDLI